MYRPCDLDLWPMKVNIFVWIEYNPVSILYKFQIAISSNSREIKYKNIGRTHTQTDTQTERQTGWKQYLATPSGGEVITCRVLHIFVLHRQTISVLARNPYFLGWFMHGVQSSKQAGNNEQCLPGNASRGELGRFPLCNKIWSLAVKYWMRLEKGTDNLFLVNAYECAKAHNNIWLQQIRGLMGKVGL